ncbi:MAG: Serine acetyltransferase, partial [uncultured Solirubrobacteraceae bacterium]
DRLCHRQAPPDGRGQRHHRLGRQAARTHPHRPRGQDRRQRGGHPRRAAQLDRGRQSRTSGPGGGQAAGGPRRRLGPPSGSDRRRAEGAFRAHRRARGRSRRPHRRPPSPAGRRRRPAAGARAESGRRL